MRALVHAAVLLPPGYHLEAVATGLLSPSAVTFDHIGGVYVLESGSAEDLTPARLLRVGPGGETETIATGDDPPWVGVAWHEGSFFVTEAGARKGPRILRVELDGERTVMAPNVGGRVNHRIQGPVVGPDGWLYFHQDAAAGSAATAPDGSVMRLSTHQGWLEVVASGFRSASGLAFSPDGRLYVTDLGLWEVEPGAWYGGSRLAAGEPPAEGRITGSSALDAESDVDEWQDAPPEPVLLFDAHGGPAGFDFSRNIDFGHVGEAFLTHFGAGSGGLAANADLVRVDLQSGGRVAPFATHRGSGTGLGRPVALRFDPTGRSLYVVDAGAAPRGDDTGPAPGVLWRIWYDGR
ncbi:MAG: hypothetical protein Q8P41_28600 [Pseudomonadota bacterium]|nr:hypothetical protein [Pseudomonadota bacterium]